MKINTVRGVLLGSALASCVGSVALADANTEAELQALRARVEALETHRNGPSGNVGDFQIGKTTIDIYGYGKADFFYDFDFDQGDLVTVPSIGEPANATDGKFGATARQTRLGIRTKTDSDFGTIGTQLELDLFGGSSSTGELRVRHANITIGDNWLIGRFWTNFMPIGNYPATVEFRGPAGITFARVPQIRYRNTAGNLSYSFSLEENNATSDDPTITAAAEYKGERGSLRVAGLVGTVKAGGEEYDQSGVTLSGAITPWAGGKLQATFVTGEAITPLLNAGGSTAVAGIGDQANDVDGFTVELRQKLSSKINVGLVYGQEDYDLASSTGTLDYTKLETLHINAFYNATDKLRFGAEYILAERTSSTGATIDADRIQFSAQLNF